MTLDKPSLFFLLFLFFSFLLFIHLFYFLRMASICTSTVEHDTSAWPSRYYGRTRHIDVEKLYQEIMAKANQKRRVSFDTKEPAVYIYEPEFETPSSPRPLHTMEKERWPERPTLYISSATQRLYNVTPILNENYSPYTPSSPVSLSSSSSSIDTDHQQTSKRKTPAQTFGHRVRASFDRIRPSSFITLRKK